MTKAKPLTAEELAEFRIMHREGGTLPEDVAHATIGQLLTNIDALTADLAQARAELAAMQATNERLQTLHEERDTLSRKADQNIERLLTENERLRAGAPMRSAGEAWLDLVEKTDRTSPAEYPDMALITRDELAAYMLAAAPQLPAQAKEGA